MSENTPNSVSVRVPQWVLDEIEEKQRKMPRPRPNRGEILTQAWQFYTDTLKSAEGIPANEDASKDLRPGLQLEPDINPGEVEWAKKLIYVLRHADDLTIEAITRNLDRFSLLTRLINKEPEARDEIDHIARQIASDPNGRVAFLHRLNERYPTHRAGAAQNERRVAPKKTRDRGTTGTGR